ncbi:MAG TPA: hypothetical protein VFB84_06375 [Micromonosporaceae bacterium]|nr:hypothetical protein [Micromonosporaceae bacterium]
MATRSEDALLVGGPRDQTPFAAEQAALVELEIDGLVHRYIRTTQERDWRERRVTVYNYDGVVDPDGAMPGVESR